MLPDYRHDPVAYEVEERSRPDEMRLLDAAGRSADRILANRRGARVLDLCCGTGLSLRALLDHPAVELAVGVDICLPYLNFANHALADRRTGLLLVQADAVAPPLMETTWDIVMLSSAYHHIEHERKLAFLRGVKKLIGPRGRAVMAENILPPYREGSTEEYKIAVSTFYNHVLHTARLENPALPDYVEGLIKRVAQYGYDGDYEYKVSMSILHRHLQQAGLAIVEERRVWPAERSPIHESGGNFILTLRAVNGAE